jgi:hypothetical protein
MRRAQMRCGRQQLGWDASGGRGGGEGFPCDDGRKLPSRGWRCARPPPTASIRIARAGRREFALRRSGRDGSARSASAAAFSPMGSAVETLEGLLKAEPCDRGGEVGPAVESCAVFKTCEANPHWHWAEMQYRLFEKKRHASPFPATATWQSHKAIMHPSKL